MTYNTFIQQIKVTQTQSDPKETMENTWATLEIWYKSNEYPVYIQYKLTWHEQPNPLPLMYNTFIHLIKVTQIQSDPNEMIKNTFSYDLSHFPIQSNTIPMHIQYKLTWFSLNSQILLLGTYNTFIQRIKVQFQFERNVTFGNPIQIQCRSNTQLQSKSEQLNPNSPSILILILFFSRRLLQMGN